MGRSIAILIDSLSGGGAERSVLTLADALRAKGVDIDFFVLHPANAYDDDAQQHRVHLVEGAWVGNGRLRPRHAAALRSAVEAEERRRGAPFDLFLANLARTSEAVVGAGLQPAYHIVRNAIRPQLRGALLKGPIRYLRWRRRFAALNGQQIITICDGLRSEIEGLGFLRPASTQRIYNGIDVDHVRALAREPVSGLPDEPFVIHVGRAANQKRHDILFRAFRRVPAPYKLVCLSNRPERLQRLARRHGIGGRLITPGFQQNPFPWISRARLFALSSNHEGFSRAVLEALVCGTPVVSTRSPYGPEEILGAELAHWLVPVGKPELLGRKIVEALETDIDLSAWRLLDEVRADRIADRYLELLP